MTSELELFRRPGAVIRGSKHWIDLAFDNLVAHAYAHAARTRSGQCL